MCILYTSRPEVVDVGCAECKLLQLLSRAKSVRELVGVDVQASLLEAHQHRLKPLITDFVLRREQPLTVCLMQGSIAEADQRLVDFDLLSCVEVIEHLDPPVLERVPAAIFGKMQPKVVIFTTPNSEFNVLFPGFHGFRHPDHRFEWTRHQFQTWCVGVCAEYPHYSVEFSGVGQPPPESSHVGCCSQIATFTRTTMQYSCQFIQDIGTPYKTVMRCEHPHSQPVPLHQRLCHEAEYWLHQLRRCREAEEEGQVVRIRLEELLQYQQIRALCSSVEDIRSALSGSTVVRCVQGEEVVFDLNDYRMDSSEEEDDRDCCATSEAECAHENWD
jgi:hypothetical protein